MIPIIYHIEDITYGVVPDDYGLGALVDCISCVVTEERNGAYELELVYPSNGQFADKFKSIGTSLYIKAKPNFTDDPQLFRVYKVNYTLNDTITVNAQHITYDLSNVVIKSGSAGDCIGACALLQAETSDFTIDTDKNASASFTITEPSSVRSWFGGKEGSLLDVYGGEWKYDNFKASLKQARGQNRGVTIAYGKNLVSLNRDQDGTHGCEYILPFAKDQDGTLYTASKVATGWTAYDGAPHDMAIDFTEGVDFESGTAIATQLTNLANAYISGHSFYNVLSITLDFVQSRELTERVDLCDTVSLVFPDGSSQFLKCVATKWDVLDDRYIETTFGELRSNIADTIAAQEKEAEQVPSTSFMYDAVDRATKLITGNLGGYVVIHDTNADGVPDEILIMDTADITTATKVWRWNNSGLGYSSTGYAGPYGLAMTSAGEIVADFISTGTLNANLIKAGILSDFNGNSSINMTTGVANLKDMLAKSTFKLVSTANVTKMLVAHNVGTGTNMTFYTEAGKDCGGFSSGTKGLELFCKNASEDLVAYLGPVSGVGGGDLSLRDAVGNVIFRAYSDPSGVMFIKNSSNKTRVWLGVASYDDGTLNLYKNDDTNTINLSGHTGNVRCVSVTQTSSRKVKDNIKPMTDEEARKVLELEAVSFDYKNKDLGTDKRGFIAEDVAEVLPNIVKAETEEAPASLDYIELIPYLQRVIKMQDARIKALEDKINGRK